MHLTQLISLAIEATGSNSVTVFDEEVDIASLSAHHLSEVLVFQCHYRQEQMSKITDENDFVIDDNLVCQEVYDTLASTLEYELLVDINNAKLSHERDERLALRIAEKSDSFTTTPSFRGCLHRFMQDHTYTHRWMLSWLSNERSVPSINLGDVSREVSIGVSEKVLTRFPNLGFGDTKSRRRLVVRNSFQSHNSLLSAAVLDECLEMRHQYNELCSMNSHAVQGGDDLLVESFRSQMDNLLVQMRNKLRSNGVPEASIQQMIKRMISTNEVFCLEQSQTELKKKKRRKKKSKLSVFLL